MNGKPHTPSPIAMMSVYHKALGHPTFVTMHQCICSSLKFTVKKLQSIFTRYMLLRYTHWTLEFSAADVDWPNCIVCRNHLLSLFLYCTYFVREKNASTA
jgi:hypothetical protein